jgi:G3E family GTPase
LAQIAREPLSRHQIGSANRLIVTKLDQAEEGTIGRLVATLAFLNPGAAISGAVLGSATEMPEPAEAVPETFADLDDNPAAAILASRIDLDPSIDWTAFAVWLSALLHARGDDIMRVKGVMRTPAGRLLLQSVRKVVQSPEILPESGGSGCGADNSIVFIGRGFRPADLHRSLRFFAGGTMPQ